MEASGLPESIDAIQKSSKPNLQINASALTKEPFAAFVNRSCNAVTRLLTNRWAANKSLGLSFGAGGGADGNEPPGAPCSPASVVMVLLIVPSAATATATTAATAGATTGAAMVRAGCGCVKKLSKSSNLSTIPSPQAGALLKSGRLWDTPSERLGVTGHKYIPTRLRRGPWGYTCDL